MSYDDDDYDFFPDVDTSWGNNAWCNEINKPGGGDPITEEDIIRNMIILQ